MLCFGSRHHCIDGHVLYSVSPGLVGRNGLHPANNFIRSMGCSFEHPGYYLFSGKYYRQIVGPSLFEKNALQILWSSKLQLPWAGLSIVPVFFSSSIVGLVNASTIFSRTGLPLIGSQPSRYPRCTSNGLFVKGWGTKVNRKLDIPFSVYLLRSHGLSEIRRWLTFGFAFNRIPGYRSYYLILPTI
jgi:hypothetical protein